MWKVPLAIVVLGAAITAVFAAQQAQSDGQRVANEFDAEVAAIETAVSSAISGRITEFNVGVDFVSSSDTVDAQQFESFFERRSNNRSSPIDGDPGFSVSEVVTDLAALEAREHAAGRSDFEVSAGLPSFSPERTVITHLERDIPVMGRSFVGFDVSSFQGLLAPPGIDETTNQVFAQVTSVSELFGGFRVLGTSTPDESEYEDALLYLISRYETNSTTGYATRLESIGSIVDEVAALVPGEFHLSARLSGADRPIVEIERRTEATVYRSETLNVIGTSRDEVIDLSPLEITLLASTKIRPEGRGYNNIGLWSIGLFGSLLAALFASMRAHQARRLADTGMELEIAQTMASTDPLTGLLNRQGMVDAIENPRQQPGTLLFIDIDNFKTVNDNDGHAEGDRVLRRIGLELRQMVRTDDVVCRLGGDEFLIFLPSPVDEARVADLRSLITTSIRFIDSRISCSIGTASRSAESSVPVDNLFRKADAAMYVDKRSKQPMGR